MNRDTQIAARKVIDEATKYFETAGDPPMIGVREALREFRKQDLRETKERFKQANGEGYEKA